MDILRIEHLSKIYGKGDTEVRALDDVSFTVPKGQFVAIIGPSGSGKSTLLHILGGVDTPTDGHVYVDGTDITTLDETALAIFRRRQIGLIYQFYNLIPILHQYFQGLFRLLLPEIQRFCNTFYISHTVFVYLHCDVRQSRTCGCISCSVPPPRSVLNVWSRK